MRVPAFAFLGTRHRHYFENVKFGTGKDPKGRVMIIAIPPPPMKQDEKIID
jgi:hypothetical protein